MSAFGANADIDQQADDVAFLPKADCLASLNAPRLNHYDILSALGGGNETARVHYTSWGLGGGMAARGTCAAEGRPADRVSQHAIGWLILTLGRGFPAGFTRGWFHRRSEHSDRISLGRGAVRTVARIGERSCSSRNSSIGDNWRRTCRTCRERNDSNHPDRFSNRWRSGENRIGQRHESARWQRHRGDASKYRSRSETAGTVERTAPKGKLDRGTYQSRFPVGRLGGKTFWRRHHVWA